MSVNCGGNKDNEGGDKNSGGKNGGGKIRWWGFISHGENKGTEPMLALSGVTAYRLDGLASWHTSFFLAPKMVSQT